MKMPSRTRVPLRFAFPFQRNELLAFLKRATSRSPTTLRPTDCWKTSTVTGLRTERLNDSFSPRPARLTFAPVSARPEVHAFAGSLNS